MKVQSPIRDFSNILTQVIETAEQHRNKLQRNEAATRAALIDPVLKALGWDPTNPNMMECELFVKGTRVDYALFDSSGKVKAIVEAKALGGNLNDTGVVMSLVSYVFTHGIQNIFLTDGLVWQHFSQMEPGHVIPTVIDFKTSEISISADYLIHHLDASWYWPLPVSVVEKQETLASTIPTQHNLVADYTPSANQVQPPFYQNSVPEKPISTSSIKAKDFNEFIPLASLKDNLTYNSAPRQLLLPDGKTIHIRSWGNFLVECVLFVMRNNPNLPIPLPDFSERRNYLIFKTKPGPQVGTPVEAEYNGKIVYINKKYSANRCTKNAKYILQKYLSAEKFKVQPGVSFED